MRQQQLKERRHGQFAPRAQVGPQRLLPVTTWPPQARYWRVGPGKPSKSIATRPSSPSARATSGRASRRTSSRNNSAGPRDQDAACRSPPQPGSGRPASPDRAATDESVSANRNNVNRAFCPAAKPSKTGANDSASERNPRGMRGPQQPRGREQGQQAGQRPQPDRPAEGQPGQRGKDQRRVRRRHVAIEHLAPDRPQGVGLQHPGGIVGVQRRRRVGRDHGAGGVQAQQILAKRRVA